jgi:hypothetical protein
MTSRLCSHNLLHIVITGFLSGVESFYHKCATVLERVFRIFQWNITAASLAIETWADFPLLPDLYSQMYNIQAKETRNTDEFNLKQTILRRIIECL